jgi:hypothetical protein
VAEVLQRDRGQHIQSILIRITEAAPDEHAAEFLKQFGTVKDILKKVERTARKAASRLQEAECNAQSHQTGGTTDAHSKPVKMKKGTKRRPTR